MRVICKTGTPLVNDMLRAYARECGMKMQSCDPKFDEKFPHLIITNNTLGIYITQTTGDGNYNSRLSIEEFMESIDKYSIPPVTLAGHTVTITKENVKVGCTTITTNEVEDFIQAYNKFHSKC